MTTGEGREKVEACSCLTGLTLGLWGYRKYQGTHLETGGHETGEGKLVNVRREGQAGPDRNLRWQGLCDTPSQGGLVA